MNIAKRRIILDHLFKLSTVMAVILCCFIIGGILVTIIYKAIPGFSGYYLNSPIVVQAAATRQDNELAVNSYGQIVSQKYSWSQPTDNYLLLNESTALFLDNYSDELYHNKMKLAPSEEMIVNLYNNGQITKRFNGHFFRCCDSSSSEIAGILAALIGSAYSMVIALAIAVPVAVMSAVYLEESAPKNKLIYLTEVSINNLAAVPSIIFGLLGLIIYINYMDLPRSSSLVGGLTLALLIIPVMIVTTRQALSNIPNSQRQAVIALGASHMQMVFGHILPLALPGIITGIILSICRAIGETAALLMIGMVAFITKAPDSIMEPASLLPVQIYMWSENFEPGFEAKTAAAILILLIIMIVFNYVAAKIRRTYEHKW